MINEHIALPYEMVANNFYMLDNRLIRISDDSRWDASDCTAQKTVRLMDERVPTSRVIYTLINGSAPKGNLFLDDSGNYADVTNNTIFMMLAYSKYSKIQEKDHNHYSQPFTARLIDKEGNRISKSFKSYSEASSWRKSTMNDIWGEDYAILNISSKL